MDSSISSEKEIFCKNYAKFCSILKHDDSLLPHLVEKQIIKADDIDEIKSKIAADKGPTLLKHISGPLEVGCTHGFYSFLDVMINHGKLDSQEFARKIKDECLSNSSSEAQITIVLTGISESGKSAVRNFFLKKGIHTDFGPVIKRNVGMVGGKLIKFVDTPGILDPDVKSDDEFEELASSTLSVSNGIHAIGIVIKIGNISSKDVKMLENLLEYIDIIPYAFVIFSNAYVLSSSHEEQQHKLNILLKTNNSLKSLHKLLTNINNRYIILESVLNKEEGYYSTKVTELMNIIDSIFNEQKQPFTFFLSDIARGLLRSSRSQTECIDAMKKELRTIKVQLDASQKGKSFKQKFTFLGASVGAIAGAFIGAVAGPGGCVAGGTVGVTIGTTAVAAIIGAGVVGSASGGIAGLSIGTGINKCRTQ